MTDYKKPKMFYAVGKKRNEIALLGKCVVRSEADGFFGGDLSKSYQCAKTQQKYSNDYHHAYFEDFSIECIEIVNGEEVSVLDLNLGS